MRTLELNIDLDVNYYLENSNATSYDELYDYIVDSGGFNEEIIYYENAIEFLSKHDASLKTSLDLAYNAGYETKDLNSEILASLLQSEVLREQFEDCKEEIEEYFNSL